MDAVTIERSDLGAVGEKLDSAALPVVLSVIGELMRAPLRLADPSEAIPLGGGGLEAVAGGPRVGLLLDPPREGGPALHEGLVRELVAVSDTRDVGKRDLPGNDALPEIRVDPETFIVTVDGDAVEPAPATVLPLAQRYSLF